MNCREFDFLVIDRVRGVELDAQTRREAEAHSAACGRCRDRLAGERALTASLEQLANSTAGSETPANVEDLLRMAFREQTAARQPRPASAHLKGGGNLRDGWHLTARSKESWRKARALP
jgi:anti-sigma factor RsiW